MRLPLEGTLLEKLRKIEALHAGTKVDGERELTVIGAHYDADEGARMRIAVATQTGNGVGIAEVPIVGGAFALSMPRVLNAGLYVGVTLYIDRNDNDTCETDEHAWDWTTRTVLGDMRAQAIHR